MGGKNWTVVYKYSGCSYCVGRRVVWELGQWWWLIQRQTTNIAWWVRYLFDPVYALLYWIGHCSLPWSDTQEWIGWLAVNCQMSTAWQNPKGQQNWHTFTYSYRSVTTQNPFWFRHSEIQCRNQSWFVNVLVWSTFLLFVQVQHHLFLNIEVVNRIQWEQPSPTRQVVLPTCLH